MTLGETVERHIMEIRSNVEALARLLECCGEGGDKISLEHCLVECPHKRCLKETLLEVITVLEETRRNFKSKRLELLRKRLLRILADIS